MCGAGHSYGILLQWLRGELQTRHLARFTLESFFRKLLSKVLLSTVSTFTLDREFFVCWP